MYKCKYCNVQSEYKYNIDRHEKSKHGNNKNVTYSTGVPSSMYVGNDVAKFDNITFLIFEYHNVTIH